MNLKNLVVVCGTAGILAYLLLDPPKAKLPEGITFEKAVEVVKATDWVQNTARGMVEKLFGMPRTDPMYEHYVDRVATKLAEGVLS